jgi:DNA helicase-2/ATP-dependent DNA helicase PcrA
VERQLAKAEQYSYAAKQELKKVRRALWEDLQFAGASTSFDEDVNAAQYLDELARKGREFGIHRNKVRKLELLRKAPYFGRIDFHDHELDTTNQIYVGVASLVDEETGQHWVYDWRAPISSLFYDYGMGPAKYEAPAGTVTGEITLKRQYRIEQGKLVYMFDSDLTINDDVLQMTLSKTADNRMKHIVYTIQREQNQAIRDEANRVLFVQGPAGCGKTSIALHRAAYLLYRYRGVLDASEIVIFSPNAIFGDYIQNVLPELGEDNIREATMQDYLEMVIAPEWSWESYYAQLAYILEQCHDPGYAARLEAIAFKSSEQFYQMVNQYIEYLEENQFRFADIEAWGQTIISGEECSRLFLETYGYLPVAQRLEKIRRRVLYLLNPIRKDRIAALVKDKADLPRHKGDNERELQRLSIAEVKEELAPVYEQLDQMLNIDVYQLYSGLFQSREQVGRFFDPSLLPSSWDQICRVTQAGMEERKLLFEDTAPFVYFQGRLEGWRELSGIKHVIIDEAQDYTLFHYQLFRNIFPKAAFTILGDLNQAVHPYLRLPDFEKAAGVFTGAGYACKILKMNKSYRSTKEIGEFTSRLLTDKQEIEFVEREGDKPKVIACGRHKGEQLAKIIEESTVKGSKSAAVICKTQDEARKTAKQLEGRIKFTLITHETGYFPPGVVVVPVYLAKGLEFDTVVIANADQEVYGREPDRQLLYTACTRALHQLFIFYENQLTSFITAVDRQLYEIMEA